MALKVYRVAVIGCPRTVLDPTKLEIGVGKSSFCCRFVKPEAYAEDHPFAITKEQWNGPTVNCDQFLYWGAVSRNIPGLHRARFQVIEHTEFVNNSSWHPYPSSNKDYISRVVDPTLTSEGKIAYKGQSRKYQPSPPAIYGRSSLGTHQTSTQIFPSEDFRVNGIAGYVCIYDPTVPYETGAMQSQLDFLTELLKAVNKTKKRCILVCTKCDAAKEDAIQNGQKLVAPYKKSIPFIECSARESINVNEAFFSLAVICKKKHFSRGSQLTIRCLQFKDACNLKKREKNQIINTYKTMLWKKVKSFDTTWPVILEELQSEADFPLIKEIAGDDLMKKLFCQRLMELKVEEASKKFGRVAKRTSSLSDSLKREQCKDYQDFLSSAFTEHPDLGFLKDYYSGNKCESVSSSMGELLLPLPPTPNSLDALDNCFSDPESRCVSVENLTETASKLESVKSDPEIEQVDSSSVATTKPNMLTKPIGSISTRIRSPSLPKRGMDVAMSSIFLHEPSLSRSEEQLWKKSKSIATFDKKHRSSIDSLLKDDKKPPLPPRINYPGQENQKIVSKPLPPIPVDEEEYIPNYEHRRKLSSSLDCVRDAVLEEPSPYIAPVDLYPSLKRGQPATTSIQLSDRPPLPPIPVEPRNKHGPSIHRSNTQYLPGKRYSHKRSRSSNCDFLKSLPRDEYPLVHQLTSYNTLNPSNFMSHSMRAKSFSPPESDLENSLKKKNSFRNRTSKQTLLPEESNLDFFGTYTRMSPAPSLDVKSPSVDAKSPSNQEVPKDPYKIPTDDGSDIGITECPMAAPPKRGERRKARRWETNKCRKNKSSCSSANRHYWQHHRQQAFEAPRYVSQPSIQNDSALLNNIPRQDAHSKRSSRDSNIYEHVDEDVLDGLRKDREDDYRASAEADIVYKSVYPPGVFPHPPTAREWHYFMHMWQLFLQWMTEHAPPEVYSVPSNIPADVGNTPPLINNQTFPDYYDEVRKQSTTSYTSINCDWIKDLAAARVNSVVEDDTTASVGAFSPQGYSDSAEVNNTVVDKHLTLRSQNPHATLNGNGKSVSSVDSGCHSHNDDSNSSGDS